MSARYLIGTGARNWNDTANWSTTSGGAGGASVPTLSDAVIFDQNSGAGDVTLNANASCGGFNSTALTQIVRVVSSVYTFSNYGDLTLNGTLSKFAFTGTAYYYQKGTGNITTNGNLFLALNRLYIDGVGITVTNLDDISFSGAVSVLLTNGEWYTNGKTINIGYLYTFIGGTLNASSSLITLTHIFPQSGVNINSETSTFKFIGSYINNTSIITFYNLQVAPVASAIFPLLDNVTASNNLTFTGSNASNYRLLIASNTIGTPRTITCNGTVTASNVDFRDITLAGTCNKDLSAITGGSGDCGGNSGIVFTTAQPQYFKKYASTANVGDAANWFSDLALTVAGRVPLPQDLGSKFLATSFDRTCTVSCNVPRIPCLDMSEVVNTVTWSLANTVDCYGSYVLGANITQNSGANQNTFLGNGEFNINTFNSTIRSLVFSRGIYRMLSNSTLSYQLTINANTTVYLGIYNISTPYFTQMAGILYMGSGIIEVTNNYAADSTGFYGTVYCETSTLYFNPASGSNTIGFTGGNKVFNKIRFGGNHTGFFDLKNSNTIAELIIDSGRKVRFTAGTTQTIAKATIGANVTLDCVTASTYTLALADITTAENANIKGCIAPVSKFFAEANSVDSGSNTNVVFGDYFTPQEIMIENRIN